jgi:hypothetical protein
LGTVVAIARADWEVYVCQSMIIEQRWRDCRNERAKDVERAFRNLIIVVRRGNQSRRDEKIGLSGSLVFKVDE